jgi:hypothetical protein
LANAWAISIIGAVFLIGLSMFTFKNWFALCFLVAFGFHATSCWSTVFYSKEEALKLAFGDDASVELQSLFPTAEQVAQIEQLGKVKLDSNLFSFYVGKKQGAIVGYAAIESHTVRTQAETLLIVLDGQGKLRSLHTLAFHEPPEYMPPERWFALFTNRSIDELTLGKDIQGVAGATLSFRASIDSARKVLAIFQVMLKQPNN